MPSDNFGNYFEMVFADIATFGKAPAVVSGSLPQADLAVFGIPWDYTATLRPGARLGPRGIREQSIWFHEVWNPGSTPLVGYGPTRERKRERMNIVDCGDVTIWPGDIMRTSESIRAAAKSVAEKAFPLMLGGDHYVMFPTYQGVRDAHPGKTIGIIQIDAHNDLCDKDAVYGTHWSGTPMRRSIEDASLDPRALCQIGLRGYLGTVERDYQLRNGVNIIHIPELRANGAEAIAAKAVKAVLGHADLIYLTVDIDSVDPSAAPGCSTPVPGGLHGEEFIALLRALGQYEEIIAMDLVEVSPPLDPTNQTTLLAAYGIFGFIEERFLLGPVIASP
jgi:agmatinase